MTLSYELFYTIIIFFSVLITTVLLFVLFRLFKNINEHAAQLVAYVLLAGGVGIFFFFRSFKTPVVEVRGFDSEEYLLVGSSFTASDNQKIKLQDDDGCVVINITDQPMFVEEVEYSITGFVHLANEQIKEIRPHSFTVIEHEPDFYPWDNAPGEITVSDNRIYATRIWVHF
jgi:hypothetical protein